MKQGKMKIASPVLIAAAVGTVFWVNAGQLTPPLGAISATGPTTINGQDWNANLPVVLSQSGSYILTSNIVAPDGYAGNGISIETDNVTLDLNGFSVIGVTGSGRGINTFGTELRNITIKNGNIRSWGGDGVQTGGSINPRLERLHAADNGAIGLAAGRNAIVKDCTAFINNTIGISVLSNGTVSGCTATGNTFNGFLVGDSSTITNCTALGNGFTGILVSNGSAVSHCTAQGNGLHGIEGATGSTTITACIATSNSGDGIHVVGGTVINCMVELNSTNGIFATTSTTVQSCTASINIGDGIEVGSDCYVVGNTSKGSFNDAGIHVTGSDNRIEGNNVTDNPRGYDVDSAGNLIIKNSASGNTSANYSIVGGNDVGPVGTAAASTSPWANIAF